MADACAAARLELEFHAEVDEEIGAATVAPAIAHTLRRVAREATTNAIKHAGARRLGCRLGADREAFTLRVEDDGRGFSEVRADGQGLGIMARRVARVGGALEHGNRSEAGASGGYVAARLPRLLRGR
jgi:signal transduction histidine kinase